MIQVAANECTPFTYWRYLNGNTYHYQLLLKTDCLSDGCSLVFLMSDIFIKDFEKKIFILPQCHILRMFDIQDHKRASNIIKYAANEIQVIQGKLTWLKEQQSWMLCPQWQCKVYTSSHKLNSQQYSINNMQPWEQLHFKLNITCTRLLNDQLQCIKWK